MIRPDLNIAEQIVALAGDPEEEVEEEGGLTIEGVLTDEGVE